jgi:serine/threonine protein kinase
MSSGKGKDNPAATAPSSETDGLLTSDDIFGDMLDPADKAPPPQPKRAAEVPAEPARKGPIKVRVSEPRVRDKGPLTSETPHAGEALPEDVAALLDAFSGPAEAATRAEPVARGPHPAPSRPADPTGLLESLVEEPAVTEPEPPAAEPEAESLLDAMLGPDDDSMGLLRDLEKLGKPPASGAAAADPAWSYDVPVPVSRTGTRFKAAAPKAAQAESGGLDLGALADAAFAEADAARAVPPPASAPRVPAPRPAPVPASPPAAAQKSSGTETYGPYFLLEKIAVGGMAELFRAKRTGVEGFEKVVAVKRILPHLSDNQEFVDMFIAEAKMVAGLSHPNIVQIFDLGKIDKSYYIAMEYVHGRDLRSILKRAAERGTSIPQDLAVLIASKLCSALDYAHRKKDDQGQKMRIVHRDISPQNILISFEGDVKLTDFGIAKAATKATAHESGALRGKLLYMSPEQAWGKPMDRRSDIFSLGLVLYEMLTGQRPFLGSSELSILEMVRECRIAPAASVNAAIPEGLAQATMKALARDPAERYADAAEMQADLERILHEQRPPTDADISRFMRLLFEQDERGEPVADEHTSGIHRSALGEPPVGPAEAPAEPPAEGEPARETSPIQKFLRRFGIK